MVNLLSDNEIHESQNKRFTYFTVLVMLPGEHPQLGNYNTALRTESRGTTAIMVMR
jgi:hypothetical protein